MKTEFTIILRAENTQIWYVMGRDRFNFGGIPHVKVRLIALKEI